MPYLDLDKMCVSCLAPSSKTLCNLCDEIYSGDGVRGFIVMDDQLPAGNHAPWIELPDFGWVRPRHAWLMQAKIHFILKHKLMMVTPPEGFTEKQWRNHMQSRFNSHAYLLLAELMTMEDMSITDYIDYYQFNSLTLSGLPTAAEGIIGAKHQDTCPFDDLQEIYACTCHYRHKNWCMAVTTQDGECDCQ